MLTDIYAGRNMAGVRPGQIEQLLVLEQLPKPVNFSGGMWPISIGGTFTLARVLGTSAADRPEALEICATALCRFSSMGLAGDEARARGLLWRLTAGK